MHPLLSFPYLSIYLHQGTFAALEIRWLGFATGSEFRGSIAQAMQLAHQHRIKGWIADDRLLGAVRPRDLEWVLEEVLLPLGSLGLQRFALLESENALNRLTIDAMYQRALDSLPYEIRLFTNPELARAWAGGGA